MREVGNALSSAALYGYSLMVRHSNSNHPYADTLKSLSELFWVDEARVNSIEDHLLMVRELLQSEITMAEARGLEERLNELSRMKRRFHIFYNKADHMLTISIRYATACHQSFVRPHQKFMMPLQEEPEWWQYKTLLAEKLEEALSHILVTEELHDSKRRFIELLTEFVELLNWTEKEYGVPKVSSDVATLDDIRGELVDLEVDALVFP